MPEALRDTVVFRKNSNRPSLLDFPMAESPLDQATRRQSHIFQLGVRRLTTQPKLEEATSLDVGSVCRQSPIFQLGVRRLAGLGC